MRIEIGIMPSEFALALCKANIRIQAMVRPHRLEDLRRIKLAFRLNRIVCLVPDPHIGLTEATKIEICNAAQGLSADVNLKLPFNDPGYELITKMMDVCLSQEVPLFYLPLSREELGFASWYGELVGQTTADELSLRQVLILGGGVNGITLAARPQLLEN